MQPIVVKLTSRYRPVNEPLVPEPWHESNRYGRGFRSVEVVQRAGADERLLASFAASVSRERVEVAESARYTPPQSLVGNHEKHLLCMTAMLPRR